MTLAKDNTPCHADRSTQVILATNNVEPSNRLHKLKGGREGGREREKELGRER